MNLAKRNVKAFSLVFVVLLFLSSSIAYAQVFTDVPDSHWAKEYIENMNKAGIITGYSDATFRPDDSVTKVQALVMMSRMYGFDSEKVKNIREKYQDLLDELHVETWYQDGVAVAIETGIVSSSVVETFYKNNQAAKPATKEEICIFLTRAMVLEDEVKNKTFYVLPFTDSETITDAAKPYVDMMIEKGIIDKAGDNQGRFNPKSTVTRAIMAKMLSGAYNYINNNNISPGISNDIPDDVETTTVSGTIKSILKATNEVYITIEDEDGDKTAYRVTTGTDIVIDAEDAPMEELAEGLVVEAEVTDDYRVALIEAESTFEEYSGKLKSIILTSPAMLTIEYEEDDDTEKKAFYIAEDADITLDDEDADLEDIDEGDLIDIKVKNNRVIEIVAESKNKSIEGTIKEIKFDPEPILVVEDEDGEKYEYPIDEDAKTKRNKKTVEITDLMIGDEVEVDIEYNVITEITAEIVEGDDEGTIKSILIADKPQLTIENKDGEEVTYYIATNADIEVDNEDSNIYGLRLGYYVEIEIESNYITSIEAEVRQLNDRYEGEIEYINDDVGIIVISIETETGQKQNLTVATTDSTTYLDADGDSSRFRNLDNGDIILVIGNSDGGIFTAKSIIILQDRN